MGRTVPGDLVVILVPFSVLRDDLLAEAVDSFLQSMAIREGANLLDAFVQFRCGRNGKLRVARLMFAERHDVTLPIGTGIAGAHIRRRIRLRYPAG